MAMVSPELLRRFPDFAGASDETLRKLAMVSEERACESGHALFEEGDTARSLYLVLEGRVDLETAVGSGERKTVDTAVAGDLLGWSALVEPYRLHLSGVARDSSRVVIIDAENLRDLRDQDPPFGLALMSAVARALSHRLEGAQVQLASTS